MAKFLVIELDENKTLSDQTHQVWEVQSMFGAGHTSHDYNAVFEVVNTVNHRELNDAVKAIKANDE